MEVQLECPLCEELSHPSLTAAPSFLTLTSAGALVPGHLIIAPKRHIRRLADLTSKEFGELDDVTDLLYGRLHRLFSAPVHFFEHASSTDGGAVACSIEHAHMHAVPFSGSLWQRLQGEYRWTLSVGPGSLAEIVGDHEYLWYRSPDGKEAVSVSPQGFPSQYMRRVIGEELGLRSWNWREYARMGVVSQTVTKLLANRNF